MSTNATPHTTDANVAERLRDVAYTYEQTRRATEPDGSETASVFYARETALTWVGQWVSGDILLDELLEYVDDYLATARNPAGRAAFTTTLNALLDQLT